MTPTQISINIQDKNHFNNLPLAFDKKQNVNDYLFSSFTFQHPKLPLPQRNVKLIPTSNYFKNSQPFPN